MTTQRTYGEIRHQSRRVANGLVGLGIEEFDRVAVLSTNRLEFIEIEVGIAAARAIMVPLNWRLREGELGEPAAALPGARDLRRGALPRDDPRAAPLRRGPGPAHRHRDRRRRCRPLLRGARHLIVGRAPHAPGRMEDPHEIIFTSGTTGQPKGVVWTNGDGALELAAADRSTSGSARDSSTHVHHRHVLHRRPPRLHLVDPAPGRHGPHQAVERLRRPRTPSATSPSTGSPTSSGCRRCCSRSSGCRISRTSTPARCG